MRINMIVGRFPVLSQSFITEPILKLVELGVDVVVYTIEHQAPTVEAQLSGRVVIKSPPRLPRYRWAQFVCGGGLFLALAARHPLRIKSLWRLVRHVWDAPLMQVFTNFRLLWDGPRGLVHAHLGWHGTHIAELKRAGWPLGPSVVSFYGNDLTGWVRKKPNMYDDLWRTKSLFLVLSEHMKRRVVALGCNPSQVKVHHLATDTRRFVFRERRFDGSQALKLLTVARLVEKKGIEYAIKAMQRVAKEAPCDINYQIIGDGPLRDQLEAIATRLNVTDIVTFSGAMSLKDVATEMSKAHIFILPSVTAIDGDQEGTPTVIAEAMACGLPVVSTFHAGISEMVDHEKSGVLVQEKDVDALVTAILNLIKDSDSWPKMGRLGREKAAMEFDLVQQTRALCGLYRSLADGDHD